MDYYDDIIPDGFGVALGLGEEIAMEREAEGKSQTDDGVLGPPVRNTDLVPIIRTNTDRRLLDLTDMNNWLVPMTKRLRSPFIEKWKRVALGCKDPDAPLLTYEEEEAYHMASNDVGDDSEAKSIAAKLKELRQLNAKLKLENSGKIIDELRYSCGKNKNNGEKGI